jgi:hypothetical protein
LLELVFDGFHRSPVHLPIKEAHFFDVPTR